MTKKVCLVDGSGYIFRAFYGLPDMAAPDGTPVNAVYGFSNMFLKLTANIPCDYCLVLFDAKRKNFRNDFFPEYKGTRKEIPENLIPQFSIIREAVDVMNLNYLEMDGYEADDLIATYAALARKKGYDVVVVSADKDLMQLIRPGVEYYDPMKGKFFTPDDVKEKFGVLPDKVVDVQALAGDSIDNVPGVPGIGLKTAAELVNQFGSLGEVLNHASEIKQTKRRENLINYRENAEVSLKLVTLKDDVPVEHDIEEYHCRKPKLESLIAFADKYAFQSLKPRFQVWVEVRGKCVDETEAASAENDAQTQEPQDEVITALQNAKPHYELIQDEKTLAKWANMIQEKGVFAFDTETTGLDPFFDKIVGLSLAVDAGIAAYLPITHKSKTQDLFGNSSDDIIQLSPEIIKKYLKPLMESRLILKIGHNIKFDMHFLSQILGEDTEFFPIDDTAVMSYVLDSTNHGHSLDELSELFIKHKMISYEEVCGSGKNKITFDEVPLPQALEYAAEDADITWRLLQIFKPRLAREKKLFIYEQIERPLINVLKLMEDNGALVDAQALKNLSIEFDKNLQEIESEIYQISGEEFNLGSPKQIGYILFEKNGIKGKKTATGAWQTGAEVLEKLADEGNVLAQKILDWRAFAKLKSTYTDSLLELLDKNSRVHTTFSQTVTNTGRLASSNPNLQNIPIRSDEGKKIRSCFVAPKGYKIISSDYSQVELRLMASVADVKALKEAFAHGADIHAATAARVFGVPQNEVDANMRRHAKAINFGIIYGISQYGLAKQIGVSNEEAKAYIDAYFREMPEIRKFMRETIAFAHEHGFVLTPFGRKCATFGINDDNKRIVANAERAAINAPIQGGAADIIKIAMNKVLLALKKEALKTRMLIQVHDELVFEAPEEEVEKAAALIKNVMENAVTCDVPLIAEVGIGNNWTEAH